ncbi:hypothetical protein HYU20_00005 [Candidatus Woesearchaeota archaeon]|nr:hypothetical protein [Candidatus Woesearchaeota archaeon]
MVNVKRKAKSFGRKGSFFVPLVVFGAIVVLISLLGLMYAKSQALKGGEKAIGEKQTKLFTVYQFGEKHLFFVDESVKKASQAALLETASSGLTETGACGKASSYSLWAKQSMDGSCNPITTPCYPSDNEIKLYFDKTFKKNYGVYIDSYNSFRDKTLFSEIPKEYSEVKVESYGNGLRLIGKAKVPVDISGYSWEQKPMPRPLFEYKVKPSFNEPVAVNFLEDRTKLVSAAPQLFGKTKKDSEKKLDELNKAASLKWSLAGYSTPSHSPPCSFVVEPDGCSYDCNCKPKTDCGDNDPKTTCGGECDTCYYDKVETVTYNDITALFSADAGKEFPYYDPVSKKVSMKSLAYDFGLSWIEVTGSKTNC